MKKSERIARQPKKNEMFVAKSGLPFDQEEMELIVGGGILTRHRLDTPATNASVTCYKSTNSET